MIERRRSPRLFSRICLAAEWNTENTTVRQEVMTESISAWGALLTVTTQHVPVDCMLLENAANQRQRRGRVVGVERLRDHSETYLVRIEFEAPAPEFWGHVFRYGKDGSLELIAVPARVLV